MYVDKFYKVLNVNNDSLIVMCVVPEGLLPDYMAKRGLAAKGDYVCIRLNLAMKRLCTYKERKL